MYICSHKCHVYYKAVSTYVIIVICIEVEIFLKDTLNKDTIYLNFIYEQILWILLSHTNTFWLLRWTPLCITNNNKCQLILDHYYSEHFQMT